MSWSTLPDDMVEVILAKLSPLELARTSPTSRSFQAAYNRHVASVQKNRCKLANNHFGRERVACMILLIQQLLKGEQTKLDFACGSFTDHRMAADGVLHRRSGDGFVYRPCPDSSYLDFMCEPGDICLNFFVWCLTTTIFVTTRDRSRGYLRLQIPVNRTGVEVDLGSGGFPIGDDHELVALVQAMLTGGLGRCIQHEGKWAENVTILPHIPSRVPVLELKAQMAPFMPIASQYAFTESMVEYLGFGLDSLEVGMHTGRLRPAALESTPSGLGRTIAQGGPWKRLLRAFRRVIGLGLI
jgi:hypothetical protein